MMDFCSTRVFSLKKTDNSVNFTVGRTVSDGTVVENRVLTRIFGQKRDNVTGSWRELHNEELHNLYSLPSVIRFIGLWQWYINITKTESSL
jgi:hypothetical protein